MEKWERVVFTNAKSHVFPVTLRSKLMENFSARNFEINHDFQDMYGGPIHEAKEMGLCLPGMQFVNESWEDFKLPGLKVSIITRDVEWFVKRLDKFGPRFELGKPYYKLHGDLTCLCLLPDNFTSLKKQLIERLPLALATAAIDAKEFNKRVESMNTHPNINIKSKREERKVGKS
jgi:hypothetical protein